MTPQTFWRASTIVKRKEVRMIDGSIPHKFLHFQVKQRTGKWCDVWRTTDNYGTTRWSCNARSEEPTNHKEGQIGARGCVFPTTISKEPFCSHTQACELYLKERDLKW